MQRTGVRALWASVCLAGVMLAAEPADKADGARQALPRPAKSELEYSVKLTIENGHVGELHFGCAAGGTDGHDRRLDDLAPPPGIGGIGYTFLVPPDRRMNYYRDVRAPGPVNQWVFFGRLGNGPITVSWDSKALPDALDFYVAPWDGKSAEVEKVTNMRKAKQMTLQKTGYLRIWTAKRTQAK